jgi:hypothetical protein
MHERREETRKRKKGSYLERRTTQAPHPPSPQLSLTLLKEV